MTSFAYIPEPDDIPPGMIHVGWYCTARRVAGGEPDGCLVGLDRVDHHGEEGEVHLRDGNHHASWAPVFVKLGDIS